MDDVMQLRRPTRPVLWGRISECRSSSRILWTARAVPEASDAISLVSNPSFNKDMIKARWAASSCGAMILLTGKR
jgi:hypothetical protein